MPRVAQWLKYADVVRESLAAAGELDAPDALERAVEANVIAQLGHLRTHPSVGDALESGQLKLHGWVYHIATGDVAIYDVAHAQFRLL
jgi:carbonic anhydrase